MAEAPNILNSMNMGGGVATSAGTGAKLVSGLVSGLKTAVNLLDSLIDKSQKFAENMTKAGTVRTASGFIDEPSSGMRFSNFAQGMAKAAAVAGTAAVQMMDLSAISESSLARQRFGFFSGQGAAAAAMTFQGMMNRGIALDSLDAARAGMMATSMGLMPSMPNFQTVTGGAEAFSRLVPGAGLTGGMQAMAALNQATSVNRLRMIGINVRDQSTGLMRRYEDIANDLWNKLNAEKIGGRPITQQDLAVGLQSGGGIDMLLNQYFGGDPVLRQGVVTELMQKAAGGNSSLESLNRTGALPDLAVSAGERAAAEYGVLNAVTGAGERGIMTANAQITAAANTLRDSASTFEGAVEVFAYLMQGAGAGNGAAGTIAGGVLGGLSNLGGSLLGSFLGTRGLRGGAAGRGVTGGVPGGARFSPAFRGLGAAGAGLGAVGQFQGAQAGEGFDWMSALLTSGLTAAAFAGTGPGALIAGLTSFGVQAGAHMLGGGSIFGEGAGDEPGGVGKLTTAFNPLDRLEINAPWKKRRDYLIDGKLPKNRNHTGVDFAANTGDPVYAVKDGTVLGTSYSADGFGHYVKIKHNDGYTSLYGHLNQKAVSSGTVKAGQVIGYAGSTGLSSGPHLHFEVRRDADDQRTHVDPMAYLSGAATPSGASPYSAAADSGLLGSLSSGVALLPGLAGAPSPRGEGGEAGYGSTTNYGGVTVNINVPKGTTLNEQTLAKEIKRVLNDQDMLKKAVTK